MTPISSTNTPNGRRSAAGTGSAAEATRAGIAGKKRTRPAPRQASDANGQNDERETCHVETPLQREPGMVVQPPRDPGFALEHELSGKEHAVWKLRARLARKPHDLRSDILADRGERRGTVPVRARPGRKFLRLHFS